MNDNKDYILKLKVRNPFIALLFTYPMYGFYIIALFVAITKYNSSPIIKIVYFNSFLFLMFYGLTVIVSSFFIYTSLKYGDIYLLNQSKIMTKNEIYSDVSLKVHKYCGRSSCTVYINFYSNGKLISRYYLEKLSYKSNELSEDLIYEIFNSKENTNDKKKHIAKIIEETKKENMQNRYLLFKGLIILLLIVIIPLIIVLLNFK